MKIVCLAFVSPENQQDASYQMASKTATLCLLGTLSSCARDQGSIVIMYATVTTFFESL